MPITINPDGTADETVVLRKPLSAFQVELGSVKAELAAINASIDTLQARKAVLQARKLELKDIENLP
tara:strand:+ start:8759 stop:8959 length:201 start_codon:yes stop_codon:yes gene_type:complete